MERDSNRMLKQSASFVLASFRPSTGTQLPHHSAARTDLVLLVRRTVRPRGHASGFDSPAALPAEWRVVARRGRAGKKSELFEHPECCSPVVADVWTSEVFVHSKSFFAPCWTSRMRCLSMPLSIDERLTRLLPYEENVKGRESWPTVRTSETGKPIVSIPLSGDTLNRCGNIGINCLPRSRESSSRKWKPS